MGDESDNSRRTRDQVFKYVVEYKREHDGLAPAVKEIAEACSLSVSSVKHHLFMLERENRIHVIGRRAIEVIGGAWVSPDDEE